MILLVGVPGRQLDSLFCCSNFFGSLALYLVGSWHWMRSWMMSVDERSDLSRSLVRLRMFLLPQWEEDLLTWADDDAPYPGGPYPDSFGPFFSASRVRLSEPDPELDSHEDWCIRAEHLMIELLEPGHVLRLSHMWLSVRNLLARVLGRCSDIPSAAVATTFFAVHYPPDAARIPLESTMHVRWICEQIVIVEPHVHPMVADRILLDMKKTLCLVVCFSLSVDNIWFHLFLEFVYYV